MLCGMATASLPCLPRSPPALSCSVRTPSTPDHVVSQLAAGADDSKLLLDHLELVVTERAEVRVVFGQCGIVKALLDGTFTVKRVPAVHAVLTGQRLNVRQRRHPFV